MLKIIQICIVPLPFILLPDQHPCRDLDCPPAFFLTEGFAGILGG
jgi:hypothetical protein